ncbi:MAG: magnesium chelatase, partial [Candidatus Sericytochromatia bacterium]|nr:magnesium chelatase [Candidatus Tanganyikabacteria bacterium]
MKKPRTVGELRRSGYKPSTVKEEMRRNLVRRLRAKEEIFPGIVGYDETVIPQIMNALLSGQDMILLGERGQAKSRLARSLVNLLDDELPIVAGSELNDDPFKPVSKFAREQVEAHGDEAEIEWIPRDQRYGEKLATPDITIADLIGEVDPIRVAEGRYLSDELTIHYGLIPRTNRGIFAINELPDLAERIQVGLFNLMEERDIQIRGYRIRLPVDVYIVASANPEDYTNRGRIITPLKDRYGSQIRTHYPKTSELEMKIMEHERTVLGNGSPRVFVPQFMKEIIAELTALARKSSDINQRSGVSVRISIANYENIVSNAVRRAVLIGEEQAVPRVSDLPAIVPSTAGKIELESVEEGREEHIINQLLQRAVLNTFNRYFGGGRPFEEIVAQFEAGVTAETSDMKPTLDYVKLLKKVPAFEAAFKELSIEDVPPAKASVIEFVLEGLHLNRRLNK